MWEQLSRAVSQGHALRGGGGGEPEEGHRVRETQPRSLQPPQAQHPSLPYQEGAEEADGRGCESSPWRLGSLLICNLKMHSKGTGLLVSALISNQWVGAPLGHLEGAQRSLGNGVPASLGRNSVG